MMIIRKRILKKSPCIPKFVLDNAELNDQKKSDFFGLFMAYFGLFFRALERPFLLDSLTHAHFDVKKVAPRSAHAPSALQLKFFKNLLYDNYVIN